MDEWAKIFYMKYDQLVETRRLVPLSTLGAMTAKAPRQFNQKQRVIRPKSSFIVTLGLGVY